MLSTQRERYKYYTNGHVYSFSEHFCAPDAALSEGGDGQGPCSRGACIPVVETKCKPGKETDKLGCTRWGSVSSRSESRGCGVGDASDREASGAVLLEGQGSGALGKEDRCRGRV